MFLQSISMFLPLTFQDATTKIEQLKVASTLILQKSNESIDPDLNQLIAKSPLSSSSLNLEITQFLYSQIELRNEQIQSMYEMLMTSIEITVEWMNKYRQLQGDLQNLQQQKQDQDKRMRQTLTTSSYILRRTMNQKQDLQREVKEIQIAKEYYRKLYQQQIQARDSSQPFLTISSNLIQSQKLQFKQEMDCQEILSVNQDNQLQTMIQQLQIQNKMLKIEVSQLKSVITQCTTHRSLIECTSQQDYLPLVPTQSSLFIQEKHTLASQIKSLGKKISEIKDSNCFSYMMKEKLLEITLSQLQMSSLQKSKHSKNHQNINHSKGKEKIINVSTAQQVNTNDSTFVRLVKSFLKKIVHDRIKMHQN